MELKELMAKIEAILFTMGRAVPVEDIAAACGCDVETVKKAVTLLMDEYEKEGHGIKIIELDGSFQMCTKREMYDTLIKITHVPKRQELTDSLLETLSIVAYKQPVTRTDVEMIRGVNSDHAINKLVEYGFVEEAGRLNAPGRPIVFGTTEQFLRCFGIKDLTDLPVITKEEESSMKQEAAEELQMSFDDIEKYISKDETENLQIKDFES